MFIMQICFSKKIINVMKLLFSTSDNVIIHLRGQALKLSQLISLSENQFVCQKNLRLGQLISSVLIVFCFSL